jgi:hypothetical protein
MTLVEVLTALSVLALGVLSALSVTVTSMGADRVNRESSRALDAARDVATMIRDTPLDRIGRTFDADPANDPNGPGTAPGNKIDLPELAISGKATCEIVLPVDATGAVRENLALPTLGMPRDLSGDAVIDAGDHSTDAVLVPYLLRVHWTGVQGDRELVLRGERFR